MNNKGQSFNIFSFMVIAFLAVLFFGGLIYAMGLINDVFIQVGVVNEQNPHPTYTMPCIDNQSATCNVSTYVNMSLASQQIFGQLNDSIQNLRLVALVYILGYAACIIITSFLVRKNPLWFFAYILITALALIFAPLISNSYESLLDSNIFAGILNSFGLVNTLILELPTLVLVIAALGGIGMFINLIRGQTGDEGL